jgi:hypothetical protein
MPAEGAAYSSGRGSSRLSHRPESAKGGAIASGGAVAMSSQTAEPLSAPASRIRFALFGSGIVIIGVVAGWTLASIRHDRPASPPAVVSASVDGPSRVPTSFVLVIDSEPQGASVFEGNQKLGSTPVRISMDNESTGRAARKLTLQRDGYLSYSIVQGPSDHDVHVVAELDASPQSSLLPVAGAAPSPPVTIPLRLVKPPKLVTAPLASAETSGVASGTPAQSAPPDIRLQR